MLIGKLAGISTAKSVYKNGSALAFVSNRERKYAARKVNCNGKAPGQAFQSHTEIPKEARVRECQKLKKRHIIKGEGERGNMSKKRLFNTTFYQTSTKIAAVNDCIK